MVFPLHHDFDSEPDLSPLDSPLSRCSGLGLAMARRPRGVALWAVFHGLTGRAVNGEGCPTGCDREPLRSSSLASGAAFFRSCAGGAAVRERVLRSTRGSRGVRAAAIFQRRLSGGDPVFLEIDEDLRRRDRSNSGPALRAALVVVLGAGAPSPLAAAPTRWSRSSSSRDCCRARARGSCPDPRRLHLVGAGAAGSVARRVTLAAAGVLVLASRASADRPERSGRASELDPTSRSNTASRGRRSARGVAALPAESGRGSGDGVFSWTFPDLARRRTGG
jgi:hypothetical protein